MERFSCGEDLVLIEADLEEAQNAVDDMVDVIGKQIISIAYENKDFVCTQCLNTASALYKLMKKYAVEWDAAEIAEKFADITGRDIEEI